MQFTLDQKKAHDPLRHISITANAGSGKTRVLVSRYCDLVERFGVAPEKIAAITFTEKAASELRGKIAEEFERRLVSEEHRAAWGRLKRARERFPSAIVSTIHGFCSQLLREFPIEIGVTPNFGVTSGYERRQLVDESLMDAIESALDTDENPEGSHLYDLARKIGRERMETILRMMFDRREMIEYSRASGVLRLDRDATVQLWADSIEAALRSLLLEGGLLNSVHRLTDIMKPESAATVTFALADLQTARSAGELIARASELQRLLLTTAGTLRKQLFTVKGDDLAAFDVHAEILQAVFKSVARFLETNADTALHAEMYADTQTLLAVHDDAIRRYDRRKSRLNVLDFEDLQLYLLRALDTEELRMAIAERFDHIMIDEFQDTNELQYAIARRLLQELGTGRLCIVGDTKQSIYGFRNADVEVFAKASGEIGDANVALGRHTAPLRWADEEIAPGGAEEERGSIKLAASFRLLPSICAYVNAACEPVLRKRPGSQFGVDYEPLVSARRSEGRGAVDVILATKATDDERERDDAEGEAEPLLSEAGMIARRLRWLVDGGEQVVWDTPPGAPPGEQPRTARYGDIAILCRKRSQFPAIEAALRSCGIPFATHGGAGFYQTQEVYDMLNYLRMMVNSRDDIATIGVLRSPFFCVSDAELFRLSLVRDAGGRDLWSRAVKQAASGNAEEALVRAVATIEDDRAMAGRIPASLLLRRVLERTGWRGASIGSERGEQNLANVDKLLEMAREFEARGFTSLFDFVERVREMVDAEEMEGEAPLNTGRDAVRLMTMHAAKGLEFPVVVLPSLDQPSRVSTEPFLDKDLGFGWNWRFNREEYRPAITALMSMRAAERERAEEARLFYVAVTRARDLLILSGTYDRGKGAPSNTMLSWALAPLGILPDENGTVPLISPELRFLEPDGIAERPERWEQPVYIHWSIAPPPEPAQATTAGRPFRAGDVRIGELPARAEGEFYSATQVMVYSQCPTKYYLKYRLGIPEELSEAYNTADRDSEDGTSFARLFRHAMERIDAAIDPETRTLSASEEGSGSPLAAIVRNALALEPIAPSDQERLAVRLATTIERVFASTPARDTIIPEGSLARSMYELVVPFGTDFMRGRMDRVVELKDGTLAAVQFKTRSIGRDELRTVSEEYLPQLRLYGWLLAQLRPEQGAVTCSVIFTEHPEEPQSYTFTRFEVRRIEETIRSAIEDIRAITYSGRRDLPTRTPHCPACAYWLEGHCLLEGA